MKLIKKTIFALFTLALISLTGCDLFGGGDEEADPTLYHLTLSYSSNVASLDDFKQEDLVATFAYGERHDITSRTAEEVEMYLENGATQEDIDKTIVRQDDGSYYFFDSDPMIITAPQPEGYIFVGFYDKKTNDVYRPILTECTMDDGSKEMLISRWNMPDRDCELEARYQVLEYDVAYCYGFDKSYDADGNPLPSGQFPSGSHSNPATYNYVENPDVTLTAPTDTFPGYEFEYWYYREEGTGNPVIVETLPKVYEEKVLHGTVDATSITQASLTLFAHYKDIYVTPTVVVKEGDNVIEGLEDCLTLKMLDSGGYDIPSAESYKYGTKFGVSVDIAKMEEAFYDFEGIYVDGVKIPDIGGGEFRLNNVLEPFALTKDVDIEIRVSISKCEVLFLYEEDFNSVELSDKCESVTIIGESTWVDDVLAFPSEISLNYDSIVKTTFNTSFTLKLQLKEGMSISECSIEYVTVTPEVEGQTYTYSFTIIGAYPTIRINF